MRPENLPDGGYDKVVWKRSRDGTRDKAPWQRNSETWWRRTTATLLRVSFWSYRRRRRDILVGRRVYVPLRRLRDVAGMYRDMSLRRRHDVFLPGGFILALWRCQLLLSWRKTRRCRSSHQETACTKDVFKNFVKSTEKNLYWISF